MEEPFPLDLSTLWGARKELNLCQLHPRRTLTEDAVLSRQMRQPFLEQIPGRFARICF